MNEEDKLTALIDSAKDRQTEIADEASRAIWKLVRIHHWPIAKVARRFNMSRPTVYAHLATVDRADMRQEAGCANH